MGILLFHPMVAPFIQEAARALEEAGALDRFVTTVQNKPNNLLQQSVCALGRLFGKDFQRQFNRRNIAGLPSHKIQTYPLREWLRIISSLLDEDGRVTDVVWEWAETGFDRKVAALLLPGLSAVYGYEHSSLATFQRAKELGIKIIYELPAAEPSYAQSLFESEIAKFPEFDTAFDRYTAAREPRRIVRRQEEWKLADRVICSSQFIKDTFAQANADISKVRIVPYGAPPALAQDQMESLEQFLARKPLFLWCSSFSIRKGAHYLLQAWKKGSFGRCASLDVYGALALPPDSIHPLPEGVRLMGSIPRSELMAHYQKADALLFPTLCDGFGMVATEAWSRGLPVITTKRAGVADMLEHQKNGLLIEAASSEALMEAIDWCLTHRKELYEMKKNCLITAASWQWSDYRKALWQAINEN